MLPNFNHLTIGEQASEQLEELVDKEEYDKMARFGESMERGKFLRHIYPLMTTLERCKDIFKHLEHYDIHLGFLLHGDEALVKEAIVKFKSKRFEHYISTEHIRQAIALSLDEDRHTRVIGFLEAVQIRYADEDKQCKLGQSSMFECFISQLLQKLVLEGDSMPFKRFLTLWKQKLNEKSADIYEIVCQQLVFHLQVRLWVSTSQKLLIDLIGQPSLLTSTTFIKGCLTHHDSFIAYGWREAIQEALKREREYGADTVWSMIMRMLPDEFSTEYPPSDKVLAAVLKKFKTKQEMEEEWAKENAPKLLEQLEEPDPKLPSTTPLNAIPECAITWITIAQGSPQGHMSSRTSEQISEQFRTLMDEKQYLELFKLGYSMSRDELLEYLSPLMTTFERCKKFFWYLKPRDLLSNSLERMDMPLVRKVILELLDDDGQYFITEWDIRRAITLSLDENRYDRVLELFGVMQARHASEDEGDGQPLKVPRVQRFIHGLFVYPDATKNSKSFRHFLVLRGDELQEMYPSTFEILCQELVSRLRIRLGYQDSRALLIDLVGQPSLLTASTFAKGFLNYYDYDCFYVDNVFNMDDDYDDNYPVKFDNTFTRDFVTYCWREAFVEGLKDEYSCGGEKLWNEVVNKFPGEFPKGYPPSAEALAHALTKFKTKQELEEEWVKANAS